MNTKKTVVSAVVLMTALLASVSQNYAFFDNPFSGDDKPKHKSSEKSKLPVRIGMSMEQVRAKLGDPDSENEESDGRVTWIYYADSVAARMQDGTVNAGCSEISSYIPFVGGAVNSAGRKASQPLHAERTGYIIRFNGNKVASYEKMKSQG